LRQRYRYGIALWYGIDQPEQVHRVKDKYGEHWARKSEQAMFDYFKTVLCYTTIQDNLDIAAQCEEIVEGRTTNTIWDW